MILFEHLDPLLTALGESTSNPSLKPSVPPLSAIVRTIKLCFGSGKSIRIIQLSFSSKMVNSGLRVIFSALAGAALVLAAPPLVPRQSVTTLTAAQVAAFKPYTWYASTAGCKPANTLAWNCGGKHLCIHIGGSSMLILQKRTAMPTLLLNPSRLVVMGIRCNSGMLDMTQPSRSVDMYHLFLLSSHLFIDKDCRRWLSGNFS